MGLGRLLLFPFRLFVPGKGALGTHGGNGHGGDSPSGHPHKRGPGWTVGAALSWLVAAALTAGFGGAFVLLVEGSTALQQRYGEIGLGQALGVSLQLGERGVFYRDVLGAALSASEISLVQVAIIFLVLLLGLRVLLRWLGAVASSAEAHLDTRVTRAFMQLAVVLLPALGILSTVVGILSTSHASREQVKLIIFGPTGIGVLGYLIANLFYFIADAADRNS